METDSTRIEPYTQFYRGHLIGVNQKSGSAAFIKWDPCRPSVFGKHVHFKDKVTFSYTTLSGPVLQWTTVEAVHWD